MNAMILAAGLGTRLRPWTLTHPKALVPVGGVPMLERVVRKLESDGYDNIVINVHHFGEQIMEFIEAREFDARISISDERGELLDTGGGIVRAKEYVDFRKGPLLVHNVDILSNADLGMFMRQHISSDRNISLLVSDRDSSRKLIFDKNMGLKGWHDLKNDRFRPTEMMSSSDDREYAFSGIYILGEEAVKEMGVLYGKGGFPVMDYFLDPRRVSKAGGIVRQDLKLIDIGKPDTLAKAETVLLLNRDSFY